MVFLSAALPWYTQAVVALTACFSIAFFAIPASMLTWGFEAEAERLFNKAVQRRRKMVRARAEGRVLSDSETSEEEDGDEEAEWRAYEEMVVSGSDSDESDGDDSEAAVRARAQVQAQAVAEKLFKRCDVDGSGELSVEEVSAHLVEVLLQDRGRRLSQQAFVGRAGTVLDGSVEAGDVGERLGACSLPQ